MKNKILLHVCRLIGMHLCKKFSRYNYTVIGIDNLNNYYMPKLKKVEFHYQ